MGSVSNKSIMLTERENKRTSEKKITCTRLAGRGSCSSQNARSLLRIPRLQGYRMDHFFNAAVASHAYPRGELGSIPFLAVVKTVTKAHFIMHDLHLPVHRWVEQMWIKAKAEPEAM